MTLCHHALQRIYIPASSLCHHPGVRRANKRPEGRRIHTTAIVMQAFKRLRQLTETAKKLRAAFRFFRHAWQLRAFAAWRVFGSSRRQGRLALQMALLSWKHGLLKSALRGWRESASDRAARKIKVGSFGLLDFPPSCSVAWMSA